MNEENLKENLNAWFTANRQGEEKETPCYWKLFHVRSLTASVTKQMPCIAINYEVDSIDESIDLMMENLTVFHHIKFVSIRLMKAKNDNNFLVHSFMNPFYSDEQISQMSGNSSNNNIGAFVDLLKEKNQSDLNFIQLQYQEQFKALKREIEKDREIDNLKNKIEGLESANNSILKEIIIELKEPVKELVGMYVQKTMQNSNQALPEQTTQSVKYQSLETYLDILVKQYGEKELRIFLGELSVLITKDIDSFNAIRKHTHESAKTVLQ